MVSTYFSNITLQELGCAINSIFRAEAQKYKQTHALFLQESLQDWVQRQ